MPLMIKTWAERRLRRVQRLTIKRQRRWAARAMAHWLDHAGRYTIRGSIVATRQPGDSPLEVQAIYDILGWHTKKTEV